MPQGNAFSANREQYGQAKRSSGLLTGKDPGWQVRDLLQIEEAFL